MRNDKHNFARRQHAAERAAAAANAELDSHLLTGQIEPTTDWDADFARTFGTAGPTVEAPEV